MSKKSRRVQRVFAFCKSFVGNKTRFLSWNNVCYQFDGQAFVKKTKQNLSELPRVGGGGSFRLCFLLITIVKMLIKKTSVVSETFCICYKTKKNDIKKTSET